MTEKWYAIRAYNTQTLYGYGTIDEAVAWVDHLNNEKEINLYYPEEIDDAAEIARLDADPTIGVCIDDELAAAEGIR